MAPEPHHLDAGALRSAVAAGAVPALDAAARAARDAEARRVRSDQALDDLGEHMAQMADRYREHPPLRRQAVAVVPGWLLDRCVDEGLDPIAELDAFARRAGFVEGAQVMREDGYRTGPVDARAWQSRVDALVEAGFSRATARASMRMLAQGAAAAAEFAESMAKVNDVFAMTAEDIEALAQGLRDATLEQSAKRRRAGWCPRHGETAKGGFCRRCGR